VTDYPGDTARILLSFAAEILTARASLAAQQAEIADLRDRYNARLADLDHYRDAAEQRYALGRALYAALPTVDPQADGNTQVKQAVAEIAGMREEVERRRRAMLADQPWDLRSVVSTLVAAADILLNHYAYDSPTAGTPGGSVAHEDVQYAMIAANAWCADSEKPHGTYLDARGIAPRTPGEPKPEEVIRRMRDEGDTPE
jgi:hypothetical protein